MKKLLLVGLVSLFCTGCVTTGRDTVYSEYKKKAWKWPIIGWFTSDYDKIPICSVGGGAGKLKVKGVTGVDGKERDVDVSRDKAGAVINLGGIIKAPSTEYSKQN